MARTGSLDSIAPKPATSKIITNARPLKGKAGKAKMVVAPGKSRSSKAGLVFPVGRIKRKLK